MADDSGNADIKQIADQLSSVDELAQKSRAFGTVENDAARTEALQAELRGVRQVNALVEDVLSSLEKKKDDADVGIPALIFAIEECLLMRASSESLFRCRQCKLTIGPLDQDPEPGRAYPAPNTIYTLGWRFQRAGSYRSRGAGEAAASTTTSRRG
jgi:hypothetical protein